MRSGGAVVKCPLANAGDTRDTGSIPGLARSPWSRRWQFTPIFFPGKSHGQRSLVGYSPWGHKESDATEHTHMPVVSQFSCSVVSNSLRPHGLQHPRLSCPSPTPGACSNSCPSSWWCHPTISSSVVPFSSCLQSFLASGSFSVSHFFTSGGPITII